MIARRRGGERPAVPGRLQVAVLNMGGTELLSADVAAGTRAAELKDFIASELGMHSFGFDLVSLLDGSKIDGQKELCQTPGNGSQIPLTLIKRNLPRASSQGFLRLQSTVAANTKPTFQGHTEARKLMAILLAQRVLVLVVVIFAAYHLEDVPLALRIVVAYAIYLVEALFFNASAAALRHIGDVDSVTTYIASVKDAPPVPKIKAKSWHWETRTDRRTVRDADGGERQEYVTHQEKVYTRSFEEALPVQRWRDNSGEVVEGFAYFPLVQIHFELAWYPADAETTEAHDRARAAMRQRAAAADDEYEFAESIFLNGGHGRNYQLPKTEMTCASGNRPTWLSWRVYLIASLAGLSWPYRWWLSRNSIKGDFTFSKQVWSHNTGDIELDADAN